MNWDIPSWYGFVLLALAAYRTWRLIAEDAILDRIREPVLRRLPKKLEEGMACPFCLGAWIVIGWWLAWTAWHEWTLIVAAPFALSGAVGVFAAHLDPD